MNKVKIFEKYSVTDLQNSINDFAKVNEVINVSMCAQTFAHEYYYAVVLYKEDE